MHELPITENILEITLRYAKQANASRVSDLYLVIGQLSSIVSDSVQFYWDIISQDTIAAGSKLHFRHIRTELVCQDCQTRYYPANEDLACPVCNSMKVKVIAGEEFFLESIEVE